ncbi:MAG: hypothetical protein HY690_17550 [Chloroflexi bacterium]|nr:hypothetical protein [Chloroflexota bacterium]
MPRLGRWYASRTDQYSCEVISDEEVAEMPLLYRDRELAELERARQQLNRLHLHVLITGMRQVGKTALAEGYVETICRPHGVPAVVVRGAHITHPAIFFRAVYEGMVDAVAGTHIASTSMAQVAGVVARAGVAGLTDMLPLYTQTWEGGADPSAVVQSAWRLPERVGAERGTNIVAVVDEVHEVFHQFARTAPYKGGGGLVKSAWDARGQVQHNTYALWVFTTSLRTVATQFFSAGSSPFYLQTHEIRVAPLARPETRALAAALADAGAPPTDAALDTLADLSGGLPGILIQMLADCPPHAGKAEVEAAVEHSLQRGRLAALYADIVAGLSHTERHGTNLLVQTLHAVARGSSSQSTLARRLSISPSHAGNLLSSLEHLGLIERTKRSTRRFCYPLMREWLLAQPAPPIGQEANRQELRMQLGFGFEARVREMLRRLKAPLTIADTSEGDYLLRPNAQVTFGPFLSVERRVEPPETDAIAREADRTLVMGCRCRREHTSGETIREFAEDQLATAARQHPNAWGMYISASGFTQGAVEEANARGIWLLTLSGLNLIARAAGEQPFTAP